MFAKNWLFRLQNLCRNGSVDNCEHQKGEAWNRLFLSVVTERLIFSKQAHPRESPSSVTLQLSCSCPARNEQEEQPNPRTRRTLLRCQNSKGNISKGECMMYLKRKKSISVYQDNQCQKYWAYNLSVVSGEGQCSSPSQYICKALPVYCSHTSHSSTFTVLFSTDSGRCFLFCFL